MAEVDPFSVLDTRASGKTVSAPPIVGLSALDQRASGTRLSALERPKAIPVGVEGLPQAVRDVAGDFSPLTHEAVGAKALLDSAAYKLKQAFGFKLSPEEEASKAANNALLESSTPAQAGAVMASLGTAPIGEAVLGASPVIAGLAKLPLFGKILSGAAIGGSTAAATGGDTNVGELAGAGGNAALGLGARVVRPIVQSDAVQKLTSAGIIPTVGRASGGLVRDIEEKLQSLPGVGYMISRAAGRSVSEMNNAALNAAVKPVGGKVSGVGQEGLTEAKDAVGDAYDNVLNGVNVKFDKQLQAGLDAAKNSTTIPLSDDAANVYDKIVKREVTDRLKPGIELPASQVKKEVSGGLTNAIMSYRKSTSPQDHALADALTNARNSVRDLFIRNAGPESADAISAADKAYSMLADVKKASKAADGKGGVFTPRQLQRAAKPGDMKSLADAAQEVLPSSVPDSGTAGRGLLAMLALSGGAAGGSEAAHHYLGTPQYLTSLALAPLLYSRPGQRYMLGDYAGQAALANQIGALSPYASAALAQYLSNKKQ